MVRRIAWGLETLPMVHVLGEFGWSPSGLEKTFSLTVMPPNMGKTLVLPKPRTKNQKDESEFQSSLSKEP